MPAPGGGMPLGQMKVLELGQVAAGPFAGMVLGDLGADVVKIERPPAGDSMRSWPPFIEGDAPGFGFSANFGSLNRNKRSVALDLMDQADVSTLKRLCAEADVLIENYRPGVLDRLGLGYINLATECPRLIYCSISGYGQNGPLAKRGAFDVTVQAASGAMSVTGVDGDAPVKIGVPIGDFTAGLYAVVSILAAYSTVKQGGVGMHIDCSMLGSLLGISALQTSDFLATGNVPRPFGSAHPRNAPYQVFQARDRYFAIAAGNDKLWTRLCELIGRPELPVDDRFRTQTDRVGNQKLLSEILESEFRKRPAAELIALLDGGGVPCAPVNSYEDALFDEQVAFMNLLIPLRLPNGAETSTIKFPVAIGNLELGVTRRPPLVGEHNAEVVAEWLEE